MPHAPKPNRRPITLIHTADWQLGKPFASITDPAKRARVQQERFEAIRRIGAVVRERQARFVVVAGDLFDSPTPTRATISAALGAVAELGVPVVAIPGNHDHAGPDSLWEQPFFKRERARLAPEFRLLTAREPVRMILRDRGDGPDEVILLPCPLLRRHEPDDPTAWIRDLDFGDFGNQPRIVIAHGSTTAFGPGGSSQRDDDDPGRTGSNTIAIDRLPLEEIDYVALGDWHGFMAAGRKAWYSGTPEIDRFPKAGQEPGHVACVTAARGAAPTVAAVRTSRFRWLGREVALAATNDGHGPAHLDDVLTQATAPQLPGEPGFDGCLTDVRLTGTVPLAGRAELDRVIESWQARLLRLDLTDDVRIAPTADEIHDLTARPDDPIIARVATELVRRLEAGEIGDDLEVVRHALHLLHGLASTTSPDTISTGAART
jgi:DNA repair exonuclease SbcCD nuclease subunit